MNVQDAPEEMIDHIEPSVDKSKSGLQESNKIIRSVIESATDAIICIDSDGIILLWNNAAEIMFGFSSSEMVNRDILKIVPAQYKDDHISALKQIKKRSKGSLIGKTIELRALRKDGMEFPVELSLSSWEEDNQKYYAGAIRNITKRKRAEQELQRVNDVLTEANERASEILLEVNMAQEVADEANMAKSEFLANMSHEIRTPMNGVKGMTELLLNTELNDDQRQYAETVKTSANALLNLVNDILDFSKIEAGKLEVETLNFDLRDLLDDFAEMMAAKVHGKDLEFLCAASPTMPTLLQGDPGRLRQILINLTGNAIKFTHSGEIAVLVSLESETDTNALVRFSVRDTGIGIPVEKQTDFFQQFTQVDSSTSRNYKGAGLGLAISQQLTEAMGGEIGINSEEDKGSEFWFTIHLLKQPQQERDLTPSADMDGLRILIVDDNGTNREILRAQVKAWNMKPDEAADGKKALQLMQEAVTDGDPYRIAILDMQMPNMNGEELRKAINDDSALKDTKLIMMTSIGKIRDIRHFEEIGFVAYLTKPVRHSELFDILTNILRDKTQKLTKTKVTQHLIQKMQYPDARILVVEDNNVNQMVVLGILKKLDINADGVANGIEAVNALETIPYDLVLMDIQMPEMDGLEATRRIRDSQSKVLDSNIAIIALTAHAMQGDKEKCLEAGMDDYLSKPIILKELINVLDKWLHGDQKDIENQSESLELTR